jgi:GNAT superfamily N-acetyltransferase
MVTAELRVAKAIDRKALLALINSAFAIEKFFVDRERTTPKELGTLFRSGSFLLLDEPDGTLAAAIYVEAKRDRAYIGLLAVRPELQGKGIGRRMMAAAEEHARASGCRGVDIRVVNLRKELPPFYRSLGYVVRGRTEPIHDPAAKKPYHFILMGKEFHGRRKAPAAADGTPA